MKRKQNRLKPPTAKSECLEYNACSKTSQTTEVNMAYNTVSRPAIESWFNYIMFTSSRTLFPVPEGDSTFNIPQQDSMRLIF